MRAWYGKGRYWFVVAASAGASTAWGWYGYKARWESLTSEQRADEQRKADAELTAWLSSPNK